MLVPEHPESLSYQHQAAVARARTGLRYVLWGYTFFFICLALSNMLADFWAFSGTLKTICVSILLTLISLELGIALLTAALACFYSLWYRIFLAFLRSWVVLLALISLIYTLCPDRVLHAAVIALTLSVDCFCLYAQPVAWSRGLRNVAIANGLYFITIGFDKFFEHITYSPRHLAPFIATLFHRTEQDFLHLFGCAQIVLGLFMLFARTRRIGIYGALILMMGIIISVASIGQHWDIALYAVGIILNLISIRILTSIN